MTDGYTPMDDYDKPILKKFLLSNAKRYKAKDISKKFLNGKYTQQQIIAFFGQKSSIILLGEI